jgi:hypothetical protein
VTARPEASERVYEVRIGRARAPRCHRLRRLYRWRWDVTHYMTAEGEHPGVHDRRVHLVADMGYTVTWHGAALAAAKAMRARLP